MLILASGSPRRKELLKKVAPEYAIVVPNVDESSVHAAPEELPALESILKAKAVFLSHPNDAILACDTVVVLDGEVLGKPKSEEDAMAMLRKESGKKQTVLSGYTYLHGTTRITRTVSTDVYFNALSEELIEDYVHTKKPLDKAGAYGIQDGYPLIEKIVGSYDNVMGLPTEDLAEHVFYSPKIAL